MLVAQLEAKGGEVCIPLPQGLRPDEVRVIFDEESLGLLMECWGGKLILKTDPDSETFQIRLAFETR